MLNKKEQRLRRARQTRIRIAQQGVARLSVNRTNLHIYASVISGCGTKVLASASTAEAEVRAQLGAAGKGGNVAAATLIGKRIAEKAKAAGVEKVAFDRAGFAYHGRVKALADAAREAGESYTIEFFMGSPDDNNALFLYNGIMEVLQEYLDDEINDYLDDLKVTINDSINSEEAQALISQFGSEEGYWQHEFEVYKINLPIEKYLESLKQEYLKNSISTQSNNQEAEETIENYNRYIEEVQSELVKQEQYEIFE
mgnify:CR=1 FL=1